MTPWDRRTTKYKIEVNGKFVTTEHIRANKLSMNESVLKEWVSKNLEQLEGNKKTSITQEEGKKVEDIKPKAETTSRKNPNKNEKPSIKNEVASSKAPSKRAQNYVKFKEPTIVDQKDEVDAKVVIKKQEIDWTKITVMTGKDEKKFKAIDSASKWIKFRDCDIFKEQGGSTLVQCISRDCAMSAGIATAFEKHFNVRVKLQALDLKVGDAVFIPRELGFSAIYLITKEKYNDKPTLKDFEKALSNMFHIMIQNEKVECLVLPKIGCGKDQLDWTIVKPMLVSLLKEWIDENDDVIRTGIISEYVPPNKIPIDNSVKTMLIDRYEHKNVAVMVGDYGILVKNNPCINCLKLFNDEISSKHAHYSLKDLKVSELLGPFNYLKFSRTYGICSDCYDKCVKAKPTGISIVYKGQIINSTGRPLKDKVEKAFYFFDHQLTINLDYYNDKQSQQLLLCLDEVLAKKQLGEFEDTVINEEDDQMIEKKFPKLYKLIHQLITIAYDKHSANDEFQDLSDDDVSNLIIEAASQTDELEVNLDLFEDEIIEKDETDGKIRQHNEAKNNKEEEKEGQEPKTQTQKQKKKKEKLINDTVVKEKVDVGVGTEPLQHLNKLTFHNPTSLKMYESLLKMIGGNEYHSLGLDYLVGDLIDITETCSPNVKYNLFKNERMKQIFEQYPSVMKEFYINTFIYGFSKNRVDSGDYNLYEVIIDNDTIMFLKYVAKH